MKVSSRGKADGNLIKYDKPQSANKRAPLGIDAFWDKCTPDPPLRWDSASPPMVELPLEPIYEETIIRSSVQSERERNVQNAQ